MHEINVGASLVILDMMGLFVVAVSLAENALNPMTCKIFYSHYILSPSVISKYRKSSFKFTLV